MHARLMSHTDLAATEMIDFERDRHIASQKFRVAAMTQLDDGGV